MAASVFCCLRWCRDGGAGHIPLKEMPAVQLDTQRMGTDVVIVKNGRRICGTGGCLANAPLHQNKSYFEFKIQSTGIWGIGVATQKANLNQIPLGRDVHSLVMRNDGALYYNNEEKNRLPANSLPQEGDVVGITYDHVELNVYLNGKNMHCPASGIRGTVYPVVYGKSEIFKLFCIIDIVFAPGLICEVFSSLRWNACLSSHTSIIYFDNENNYLHGNTKLGKYRSIFSVHLQCC
uniref:SPRY domain-containing protein 7 n=1 Tax=Gallus gallus TaxID=9031 RepID=A0A8V0XLM6_CHICK